MRKSRTLLPLYFMLFISIMIFLTSCISEKESVPITIGISKALPAEYYGNYEKWLTKADTTIICLDLYHMSLDSALMMLDKCSGLLITGGPDVYPGRYNMQEDTVVCGSFDLYRDSLEFALIKKAKALEMPILGICRGLQIFNIYHDGSLYADIPTQLDSMISHRCPDTYDCNHEIRVMKQSGLFNTSGKSQGIVNSNHHQGIRKLGNGLQAMARTNEGLIEAIEYADPMNMPFFMGVQWHPERMDPENPFSLPLAMYFIQEAKLYSIRKTE